MKIPRRNKTKQPNSQNPNKQTRLQRFRNSWTSVALKILNGLLPLLLLLMIRLDLIELAVVLALFSKWRVFTVKPRHLVANLRSNGTDIIVKLGTLSFMIEAGSNTEQLAWTGWYVVWLTVIKPMSNHVGISLQAAAGTLIGLSALFQYSNDLPLLVLLVLSWFLAITTSRHLLSQHQETWVQVISYVWGFFVVQMVWVLYHWTLVYIFVPQIALVLIVVGYAFASIYHARKSDELKPSFMRQQFIMTTIALLVIALLADWQGSI